MRDGADDGQRISGKRKEQTMSRWIDAEWLMNFFTDIPDNFTLTIGNLRATVNEAPSIDIVRCGECKHWERLNYEAPKEGWCDDQMPYSDGRWVDADDFCSYGEREDNERHNIDAE